MLTRREALAKGLTYLVAGGSLHLVWNYVGWARASNVLVTFPEEPRPGEVLYRNGIYLLGREQGPLALSSRCPHLGCQLEHDKDKGRFSCPCHGSRFTLEGKRIAGPAQRGMTSLALSRDQKREIYRVIMETP